MFNTIKFIFGSLFSNRRLVDESNEHPIWLALIIFLLSLCAAVLPMTITSLNVQGSQILTVTENYSLDYSLSVLSRDYLYTDGGVETEDQVIATIRDDQLQLNVPTFEADIKFPDDDKVSLAVRYTSDQTQVSSIIQDIKTSYIVPNEEATDDTLISEVPSMLIFTPSNYYIYLYAGTARVSFTETNGEVTITSDATASTGMDALCHAIESYSCIQKNPMSDSYAISAISLIRDNLFKVMENGNDAEARLNMANASLMAGVAFSNSMVGLVHAIGHSLGAVCHVPHGDAISILLPYVLEYNLDVCKNEYANLLFFLADEETYIKTLKEERANKTIEIIKEWINKLNQITGLPNKLEISDEDIEKVAKIAINDGAIIVNPKKANYEDIVEILKKARKN